jgi:AAA+ superfamily predicted ATPase
LYRKEESGKFKKDYMSERNRIVRELARYRESIPRSLEEYSEEEKPTERKYNSWAILPNFNFIPSYPTTPQLPPGFYEIRWNSEFQTDCLIKKEINVDELYYLPSNEITDIVRDIENFWESVSKFKEYRFVHKRGILLWGEPGCGKSAIIQLCTKHLINELGGIVINVSSVDELEKFNKIIDQIRTIEPHRPIITILEDVDSLAGEEKYATSLLLNLLDGIKQTENIVYIATTNYPEKLEDRITNRPSRFDRRYHVLMPSKEVREAYFRKKMSEEDIKKIDLEKWIKETDNMSIAHLRELVISVIAMENTFEDTISRLKELAKKPMSKKNAKEKVGFR